MTAVPGFPNFATQALANQIAGQILQGVAVQLAQGIVAQFFNPLNAGLFAFPQLPNLFNITGGRTPEFTTDMGMEQPRMGGGCWPLPGFEPAQSWSAQLNGNGTGSIELGDGYSMTLNEHNSEITIHNANTGETTTIWGDPHVKQGDTHAFDFWGTTTFQLGNGTKITINTEQWNGNPNAYVASQVVITRGSQALVVDGISQNRTGDLKITQSNTGYVTDAAHRDGYVLKENAGANREGQYWTTEIGTIATQKHLDATRVGAEFGPGSQRLSLGELNKALTGWLLLGSLAGLGGGFGGFLADAGGDRQAEAVSGRGVNRAFA